MIIEIKGVQFVNKGAELMLHAILEQVQCKWPDAKIVLEANPNSPYVERIKLGAYQKISLRKNVIDLNSLSYKIPKSLRDSLMKKWGIITEADIDVVLDASGFSYGDQWGSLKIRHLASELNRSSRNKKKYIFMPQALGPFTRAEDIKYLKSSLPKASLICARERASYSHIEDIAPDIDNLKLFPDFTNLVTGIIPDYYVNGESKVVIIPNSNMINKRNKNQDWVESYLQVLSDSVKVIRDMKLIPVLLNHEGAEDGDLCNAINARFNNELELIEEADPLKVKGIIGASKAIICSRFHGCVSALAQKTPCLGTSWSHKYEQLFLEYSKSEGLIQPSDNFASLEEKMKNAIATINDDNYISKVEKYKEDSKLMWENVFLEIMK